MLRGKDGLAASLLAHPDDNGKGGWFLLLMSAAGREEYGRDARAPWKREVTLVIDRSGSMAGEKLDQARAAALQVVEGLDDGESFNLIVYNEAVESFAREPVKVTRESVREAREFIDGLRVSGGTNIHGALERGGRPAAARRHAADRAVPDRRAADDRRDLREADPRGDREEKPGQAPDLHLRGGGRRQHAAAFAAGRRQPGDGDLRTSRRGRRGRGGAGVPAAGRAGACRRPNSRRSASDGKPGRGRTSDVIPARLPDFFADDQVVVTGRWSGKGDAQVPARGARRREAAQVQLRVQARRAAQPVRAAAVGDPQDRGAHRGACATSAPTAPSRIRNDPRVKELVERDRAALHRARGAQRIHRLPGPRRRGLPAGGAARGGAADFLQARAIAEPQRRGIGQPGRQPVARTSRRPTPTRATVPQRRTGRGGGRRRAAVRRQGVLPPRRRVGGLRRCSNRPPATPRRSRSAARQFAELVDQLVGEGRQSCLALGPNARIQVGEKSYVIR